MSISAVSGVPRTSVASIEAQVAQLRRQERRLTRELASLVSDGGTDESTQTRQQLLEAQIVVIRMRIAQLESRRSEAVQAALREALPALSGAGVTPAAARGPAAPGRVDLQL